MVQEVIVGCSSIQGCAPTHCDVQWSYGVVPPGRPLDKDLEHTIRPSLPRTGEGMGELHKIVYPLMTNLHLGYHHMRESEHDIHRFASRIHYESLVMPLGLTHALVTFQAF